MSKPDARAGMTRRQLIRAAAATGVAAWTAPIITGSVSSAALGATASGPCAPNCSTYFLAKVTGPSSCVGIRVTCNGQTYASGTDNGQCDAALSAIITGLGLVPGQFATGAPCPPIVSGGIGTGAVTISMPGNCKLIGGVAKNGQSCTPPVQTIDPTVGTCANVTFDPPQDISHLELIFCCTPA